MILKQTLEDGFQRLNLSNNSYQYTPNAWIYSQYNFTFLFLLCCTCHERTMCLIICLAKIIKYLSTTFHLMIHRLLNIKEALCTSISQRIKERCTDTTLTLTLKYLRLQNLNLQHFVKGFLVRLLSSQRMN